MPFSRKAKIPNSFYLMSLHSKTSKVKIKQTIRKELNYCRMKFSYSWLFCASAVYVKLKIWKWLYKFKLIYYKYWRFKGLSSIALGHKVMNHPFSKGAKFEVQFVIRLFARLICCIFYTLWNKFKFLSFRNQFINALHFQNCRGPESKRASTWKHMENYYHNISNSNNSFARIFCSSKTETTPPTCRVVFLFFNFYLNTLRRESSTARETLVKP